VQFSPASYHFISLQSRYSPQHPVLRHPQSVSLGMRGQESHPYNTKVKFYLLSFIFFESR
jgi:hypothetical protein